MTPVIVARDELIVVGFRMVVGAGSSDGDAIWREKVLPRQTEVQPAEKGFYGVFNRLPGDDSGAKYEYVAGKVTNSLENIPVGMVGWVVPAGTYAEIETTGVVTIGEACRFLIADWLPDSGYRLVSTPMFAHTLSDKPDAPDTIWKIDIPVETPEALAALKSWLE